MGLLRFRREAEDIQNVVREREKEVGELLKEKKETGKDVVVGRALLEVDHGLGELEVGLGIKVHGDELKKDSFEDEDEEDEGEDGHDTTAPMQRLQRHTRQYVLLKRTIDRIGPNHPFLGDKVAASRYSWTTAALRQARMKSLVVVY